MATRSANRSNSSRSTTRSSGSTRSSGNEQSAFRWGSTGAIAGAALGGAALAIAANMGRKFLSQAFMGGRGNWAESLAQEHEAVLMIFDKMLATDRTQTTQRKMLLMKLGYALDKHAYAEEHVVYPCLRESNDESVAALLETEHGEVKTYLHRLANMPKDSPEWLGLVAELREDLKRG